MSYVSTYDRRLPKPKGVGLAIGIHAAVIAVIVAMPGIEIIPKDISKTKTIFIKSPEPPEQIFEEPKPDIQIPQKKVIRAPIPPIDRLPRAPDATPTKFTGGDEALVYGGSGEVSNIPFDPIDLIQPTPDPIIVEARLNTRYTSQFQPRYPSGLLRLDEEGVVSVRVLVGTNGRAKDIQLVSSPHDDFWKATQKHALRKWRFKPATQDGKAIESWISLKVRFEIST